MKRRDELFKSKAFDGQSFEFNEKVVEVFEDMLSRSIPCYEEGIRMSCEIITHYLPLVRRKHLEEPCANQDRVLIYDLGSSTGYFLKKLIFHLVLNQEFISYPFEFIGVDRSKAMIAEARLRCKNLIDQNLMEFQPTNLNRIKLPKEKSYAIILNYTLQFLSHMEKSRLLKNIYGSLKAGGILILSEKIELSSREMNQVFIDSYHDFKKRNGYHHLEIQKKSQSLAKVLFLQTVESHVDALKKVGFNKIEITHKWYNFVSFLVVK